MAQEVFREHCLVECKCLIYIMVNHHQIIYDNLYVQHEHNNSIRLDKIIQQSKNKEENLEL